MSFTGVDFLCAFLPILLVCYYFPLFRTVTYKNLVLCIAGLLFYTFGEPHYVILLIASVFLNWGFSRVAIRTNHVIYIACAVIINICILIGFKYQLFGRFLPALESNGVIAGFPLGLSYYTFMAISYDIDTWRMRSKQTLIDAMLYVTMFTSIMSGPITQYSAIQNQIKERIMDRQLITNGVERFVIGAIKKIYFADTLAYMVERCFDSGDMLSFGAAWMGALAFSLQIYYDFSGYSDMAIGLGEIFGFSLCENFDYPYCADSISDFWHRWHISLTKWFTRYVYIPMGGNRVPFGAHVRNLLIVWILTGLWHGTGWTFIIWALIQFAVQFIEKYTPLLKLNVWMRRTYTLLIIAVSWVIFRSQSLESALMYIKRLFWVNSGELYVLTTSSFIGFFFPLFIGTVFAFPIMRPIKIWINRLAIGKVSWQIGLYILFVLGIAMELGFNFSAALYVGF